MALPQRAELKELYKIAIYEYHFEVNLNWQRMQYYLVFNVAILGAALGLLQLRLTGLASQLVALMFFVGAATSLLGSVAVRRGHGYYREAVLKKTLLEDLLGYWDKVPNYDASVGTLAVLQRLLAKRRARRLSTTLQAIVLVPSTKAASSRMSRCFSPASL